MAFRSMKSSYPIMSIVTTKAFVLPHFIKCVKVSTSNLFVGLNRRSSHGLGVSAEHRRQVWCELAFIITIITTNINFLVLFKYIANPKACFQSNDLTSTIQFSSASLSYTYLHEIVTSNEWRQLQTARVSRTNNKHYGYLHQWRHGYFPSA